jgi:tetratricopeptide (TPR) repeat protein
VVSADTGAKHNGLILPSTIFLVVFIAAALLLFRAWWGWMPMVPAEWRAVWLRDAPNIVPVWAGFLHVWGGNLWSVVLLAVFELASLGAGRLAYRWVTTNRSFGMWDILFSLGLGNGLLGTMVLGAGLAGLLYRSLFAALLVIGLVSGIVAFRESLRENPKTGDEVVPYGFLEKILLGFCVFIAGVNFLGALIPEWFYDSLIYHLAVPQQYAMQGKIHWVPYSFVCFNYPLLTSMQYLVFMVLGNDIAPRLLQWFDGLLCAATAFGIAGIFMGRAGSLLAAAVFLSQPVMRFLMAVTMDELPLTWFSTLALAALLRGIDGDGRGASSYAPEGGVRPYRRIDRNSWLFVGAWLLGFAHGSKYVGVLASSVLVCWLVFWSRCRREGLGVTGWRMFLVVGWAAAWTAPWLLKNWLFAGNPVSPFLGSFFPSVEFDAQLHDLYLGASTMYRGEGLKDWILLPFRVSVENPSFGGFTLNPFFILCVPAALLLRGIPYGVRVMVGFAAGYAVLWALATPQSRFLAPLMPAASVVTAWSLVALGRESVPVRAAVGMATAWILVVSANAAIVNRLSNRDIVPYVSGRLSRPALIRGAVPYYPAMERADEVMGRSARIMFVWESQIYYSPRPCFASNFIGYVPLDLAKRAVDGRDLVRLISRLRVTHILVDENVGKQYFAAGALNWGKKARDNFTQLWRAHLRPVYSNGWLGLYELLAEPVPPEERRTGMPSFFVDRDNISRIQELVAAIEGAFSQGRMTEVLAVTEELVRLMPGSAWAHSYRGYANAMLGRRKEAIADYLSSIRAGYPSAVVHFYLARMLDEEGRTGEALVHCLEAIRLEPRDQGAKAFGRDVAIKLKRFDTALDLAERMLAAEPGDAGLRAEVERIGKLVRSGSKSR